MQIRTQLHAQGQDWGQALLGAPAGAAGDPALEQERTQQQQQDRALIRSLQARDREVRAHEQAHASVGGAFAGAASFTYKRGPDGVLYAVGGEVPIDISPVPGDPGATARKAEQVRRAALAPRDPSSVDRRVALRAQAIERDARQAIAELAAIEREAARGNAEAPSAGRRIDTTA